MKAKMRLLTILCLMLFGKHSFAQLYFPPNGSNAWDSISPVTLGWCPSKIDSLYDLLESENTKAFILLKDGKIVLEKYFNGHTPQSSWYWASAGKGLTALMVGIAQEEDFLNINDTVSNYLGYGWTSCSALNEERISIKHQLSMSSGLNDAVADPFCISVSCLQCIALPGTRWAYHNAPYTLLDGVLENATGRNLNVYVAQKLKTPTGMDGLFVSQGFNQVFVSSARSMARFGLLILNRGFWNNQAVLSDSVYFNQMVNTSQSLNEAYGYLWWLNGKNSFRLPETQFLFNGSLMPNAPADMVSAMGKNGQFINVVPSQNLVWIRMGDSPDNALVPFAFNNQIWSYINALNCNGVGSPENQINREWSIYPNPVNQRLFISTPNKNIIGTYEIIKAMGICVVQGDFSEFIDVTHLISGVYWLKIVTENQVGFQKFIKNE